tara:strand:+ start:145 stop:420 length:276 start_codon:yes stop_codon:yes gene_type:complete
MSLNALGYTAVVLGAISTIPQIYQIVKTKKVRDINFLFFVLRCTASFLYIIYGVLKPDYVMMASAIAPTLSEITVLVLYYKYNNNENSSDE